MQVLNPKEQNKVYFYIALGVCNFVCVKLQVAARIYLNNPPKILSWNFKNSKFS